MFPVSGRAYCNYCLHMSIVAREWYARTFRRTRTRELSKLRLARTNRYWRERAAESRQTRCVVVCVSSSSLSYGNCYARWLYYTRASCWDTILRWHARDPSNVTVTRRNFIGRRINVCSAAFCVFAYTGYVCPRKLPCNDLIDAEWEWIRRPDLCGINFRRDVSKTRGSLPYSREITRIASAMVATIFTHLIAPLDFASACFCFNFSEKLRLNRVIFFVGFIYYIWLKYCSFFYFALFYCIFVRKIIF